MAEGAPQVCVIVSTFNARSHLQACLDSVYAQTSSSWQIIVIDGGSRDGTVDVIRANGPRLHFWTSEPDRGVYDAWNKALPHVTADWVIFLGADDGFADPRVLADLAPVLRDAEGRATIVYGKVGFIDEAGTFLREEGGPWAPISGRFQREMCLPHQGVLHHRKLFADARCFDSSFRYAGDYDVVLGAVLAQPPVFVDRRVAYWRQGGLTSNPAQSIKVLREFRRARAKHGLTGNHPRWTEIKAWIKFGLYRVLGVGLGDGLLGRYRRLVKK